MNSQNKAMGLLSVFVFTFAAFLLLFVGFSEAQSLMGAGRAPKIKIGGKEVLTNAEIKYHAFDDELPAELKSNRARLAIENRHRIQAWNHNAVRGPEGAPVTLLEITDFSCLYCQDLSKAVDKVYNDAAYKNKIRHIVMHVPVDKYNMTNAAAFYSRLAFDADRFWEYREKLYEASSISDNVFIDKLLSVGVEEKNLRRMTRENARRYYRELDADTKAARNMNETKPPVLYVNGIKMG
ncbi:MAG: protein-disulfide isomerase, partial [bacterium]